VLFRPPVKTASARLTDFLKNHEKTIMSRSQMAVISIGEWNKSSVGRLNDFTNGELLLTLEPEYISSKIEQANLPAALSPKKSPYVD
jgi:hypothetical protein